MAKVSAQCEYMTNAFPAGQVKPRGSFAVALDDKGEHLIFTKDERDRLCLILKGNEGHNELVDLSHKLGFSKQQLVRTFAVSQNGNGTIHLVIAIQEDGKADQLFVLQPMSAKREDWIALSGTSAFYKGPQWDITIKEILLGTSNDGSGPTKSYPQIHLVHQQRTLVTEDIWILIVNSGTRTWANPHKFEMPVNAGQIVSKCIANLPMYRGMFVLYKESKHISSKLSMRFVGLDPEEATPVLKSIEQIVPADANQIASFDNGNGFTDLLIGGKQLSWVGAQGCVEGNTEPITLDTSDAYVDVKQLHVSQTKEWLSVWSLTASATLSYQEFDARTTFVEPMPRTPPIPLLLGDSTSDRFATVQSLRLGQKLFVINRTGGMVMLEQDNQTALWHAPVEVLIPEIDEMTEFDSYTIKILVQDSKTDDNLVNSPFKLRCSTTAEMLVNGKSKRGSPEGVEVSTDASGAITVILRSDESLAAPILTLEDLNSQSKRITNGPYKIDPSNKLFNKLADVKNSDDLKSLKLPDGTFLVKSDASKDDLESAYGALKSLGEARKSLAAGKPIETTKPFTGQSNMMSARSFLGDIGDFFGNVGRRVWGGLKTIGEKIKQGAKWAFEKVGEAWKFVVRIAGKVWDFVVETVQHVVAVVQKVLETIVDGVKKVLDFIKFLFEWDDILDVKNMIVNLTTQGLLWGVDAVALLEENTNEFFEDLKTKVRALKGQKLPPDIGGQRAGKNPDALQKAKSEQDTSKEDDAINSPQASYGSYHLSHSGGPQDSSKGDSPIDRILARVSNLGNQMEQLMTRLISNFGDVFKTSTPSLDQIFAKLGIDLLEDLLGLIQAVIAAILGAFSEILLLFTDGINQPIQIPILSALYKKISRGSQMTILDVVALLLAIPATILFKIVTGKKPKDMEGVGSLTQRDAHRGELDQRMGRVRQQGNAAIFEDKSQFRPRTVESTTTHVVSKRIMANSPSPKVSSERRTAIEANQKRFIASSSICANVLKLGIPIGGFLFYGLWSWPKTFVSEGTYSFKKCLVSAALKLVVWLGQFASIAKIKKEDILNGTFSFKKIWDEDPWFAKRFVMWVIGAIPVFGALAGKKVSYILGLFSNIGQMLMLAILHIESWAASAGYSVYLAVEEWIKIAGKTCTNIGGLLQGSDGFTTNTVALALTTGATMMTATRVILEWSGKRDILCTGLDLI
ncbi:hypothetical protein AYL99_04385 [Fonsecaea erecta]|uniref:Uncharacterized protein n=1 Tax=Fonsecaea erecta TaxID=1367422 RepID=A0A178ZRA4_9EURO|nr:hypothetical protein AYL99_04385 [Fonsecaea erecta]OAP62182.1 hypothetical protein AYL99_04385 [Fonsecaea erecta]